MSDSYTAMSFGIGSLSLEIQKYLQKGLQDA